MNLVTYFIISPLSFSYDQRAMSKYIHIQLFLNIVCVYLIDICK